MTRPTAALALFVFAAAMGGYGGEQITPGLGWLISAAISIALGVMFAVDGDPDEVEATTEVEQS